MCVCKWTYIGTLGSRRAEPGGHSNGTERTPGPSSKQSGGHTSSWMRCRTWLLCGERSLLPLAMLRGRALAGGKGDISISGGCLWIIVPASW